MANFINVQNEKDTRIIDKLIDGEDFLGLCKDRTRLVPYGVALGVNNPTVLKNRKSLMRAEQVKNNHEIQTMLTCAKVYQLKKDADLNVELDFESILDNADRCLNTGLDEIEETITSIPELSRNLRLLEELDDLFERVIKK